MPNPGHPFPPSPDFNNDRPPALPDLLAGLENNALEPMPTSTPVNASMTEFLASLKTLLDSYEESPGPLAANVPEEAVQDFAHRATVRYHHPEAALDFGYNTGEMLNYLLSQAVEPEVREDTAYSLEALEDFAAGTQNLLKQLLRMADQEEVPPPASRDAFEDAEHDLPGGLLVTFELPASVVEPEHQIDKTALPAAPEPLLDEAMTAAHDLGEAPREYIDESDEEQVDRPAGPFEMLLDAIDAELPPAPRTHGVAQSTDNTNEGERFVAFELGVDSFALPFECVLETDRLPRWTHVPGMPAHLRGVINLRGEIIPLVDLRPLFGFDPATEEGRMLVMRSQSTKIPLGLVVDRLAGFVSVRAGEIRCLAGGSSVLRGVAVTSGRKVALLDPRLIAAAAYGDHALPRHSILTHELEEQLCLEL